MITGFVFSIGFPLFVFLPIICYTVSVFTWCNMSLLKGIPLRNQLLSAGYNHDQQQKLGLGNIPQLINYMCLIYLNQDEDEIISIDKHRQFIDNANKRITMPQESEGGKRAVFRFKQQFKTGTKCEWLLNTISLSQLDFIGIESEDRNTDYGIIMKWGAVELRHRQNWNGWWLVVSEVDLSFDMRDGAKLKITIQRSDEETKLRLETSLGDEYTLALSKQNSQLSYHLKIDTGALASYPPDPPILSCYELEKFQHTF